MCIVRVLGALVVLVGLTGGTVASDFGTYIPDSGGNLACSICHSCEFPTNRTLCLNKNFCMRSKVKRNGGSLPAHDIMVLNELEKVYDPVFFDHQKHAQMSEMSGGCENCHHFVPPSTGHPACKECHAPENERGKIQPGLKGAYHNQCMSCHEEWNADTHCELCHRKKIGGMSDVEFESLPFRLHQNPLAVMDLIIFDTDYDEGDKVPFHHLNHVEKYNRDCSVCHQDERCSSCHVHGTESHPLGLLADIDLHDTCYQCHDEDKGCDQCHGRNSNDLFDHGTTGWTLQPYHKVLQCNDCHQKRGKYTANDPRCETCHYAGWDEKHFNHGITGVVLDNEHGSMDCTDCHAGGVGTLSACDACHDDGRKWQRHASFGAGIE